MRTRLLIPLGRCLLLLALLAPALTSRPAAAAPPWHLVLLPHDDTARLIRLAPPAVPAPGLGEGPVTIEAREITREREGAPFVATGGVTLTQGAARLTAEKLTADPETGDVVAEGDVVFTEPGRTVRGQTLNYNTDTRRVRATDVQTVVQGVIVRARTVDVTAVSYQAGHASLTTCDLPHPHYRLTARSIRVTPNDRIVARHVGVTLFGLRLLTVPRLVARIGAARGEGDGALFPRVGTNSRDSLFVERTFPLIQAPRLSLDLDARLSLRRGFTGGFEAAAPAGRSFQFIGALKYRDDAPNQRNRFLEVDRVPEVGIFWISPAPAARSRPAPGERRQPSDDPRPAEATSPPPNAQGQTPNAETQEPPFRPLQQVGSDVAHQPALLRPPTRDRWYLRAQSTVGYFHQRARTVETGVVESRSGARLDLRGTGSRAGLRLLGVSLPVVQLFFRQSYYDAGDSYRVVGAAVAQDWRLGSRWSGSLRAFLHKTYGQTPFEFDRVEIRTELQPGFVYTVGGTTLSWLGRLDVDRRELFDQEFAVARVFHCLEPRISYRTRRRQIGLDLRVVGLQID